MCAIWYGNPSTSSPYFSLTVFLRLYKADNDLMKWVIALESVRSDYTEKISDRKSMLCCELLKRIHIYILMIAYVLTSLPKLIIYQNIYSIMQ